MSELKKCPFCGGEAKIDKTIANTVSVECTVCHASSRMILCTEGDIEQKAIEAWNNRKPIDIIVKQLEEVAFADIDETYVDNAQQMLFLHDTIKIVKEEGEMNE